MDAAVRTLVRERAGNRCEYCLHPQEHAETTHHVEHILARQHGGCDEQFNLASACTHWLSHTSPHPGVGTRYDWIIPALAAPFQHQDTCKQ